MRKKIVACSIVGVAVLLFSGCVFAIGGGIEGSGSPTTASFEVNGFSGLEISHSCEARITRSDRYRVDVTVDDNIRDLLVVRKEGSILKISLRPDRRYRRITFRADIAVPELTWLQLSGASSARLKGFDSERPLRCRLSGASRLFGSLNAGDTRIQLSGASHVVLRGRGQDLGVRASGASSLDLGRFTVRNVDLDLSGASRVTVRPAGQMDADTSGASSIQYYGNPVLGRVSTSGASTIARLD